LYRRQWKYLERDLGNKKVSGELKDIRSREKGALEKLADRRSDPSELISLDLSRRASELCAKLGKQIALLIGRDGKVTHVVLGTKDRVYLPNLGRYRLDSSRLRRLRMVVFLPDGQHHKKKLPREYYRSEISERPPSGVSRIDAPQIAPDLITDLEKLRLDGVLTVAVDAFGQPGSVSLACLVPLDVTHARSSLFSKGGALSHDVRFTHGKSVSSLDVDFQDVVAVLESGFKQSHEQGYDTSADRAILVGAYTGSKADADSSMAELAELARTANIVVADQFIQKRRSLDPKTVIGRGKVEEIVLQCLDLSVDILIFDRELNPAQLRSLGNLTDLKIIDRSMLILDIFSQRARSSEGRLQVELAQLKYSLPRLSEKDDSLSRLAGGIGGRGPGETKLEVGRRRARDRIAELERKIEKVSQQRGLRRERRQSRGVPVIAIVGYTNAGKSTLLNALTKGNVLAESKLFATLDTSSRRMRFPNEKEVIFVDTVGFIRELPKELINAFRATLEEVGEADLLLHVVDGTNNEMKNQISVVQRTLSDLGFADKPSILVLNKCDLLSPLEIKAINNSLEVLPLSATSRMGFPQLISEIQTNLLQVFTGQDPGGFVELESGIAEFVEESEV
jgi:GTP-binding protein HflX